MAHIARWDLDKTYLRTEFDTVRELVKTALERADQKRSHPGAAAVLRELQSAGVEIHVLSGSPEQMRRRLAAKLRMDGIRFSSLTLKPNLQNLLKLRFRSIKGQLGYKLPALLAMRAHVEAAVHETLVGDDAEADAFIYSLYASICAGVADASIIEAVMRRDRCHPEEIEDALRAARLIERPRAASRESALGAERRTTDSARVAQQSLAKTPWESAPVERILIHLDRQTPPGDFDVYGARLASFYNYFQAALVLLEDGRISADAVLRVGTDLVLQHRFDGDALVRSYLDLAKRGQLRGTKLDALLDALERWPKTGAAEGRIVGEVARGAFGLDEVLLLARRADDLRRAVEHARPLEEKTPDWLALVDASNRRRR